MIKDEILRLRENGATVIFSTHRMESVEELCDDIALIHQSNKILDGKLMDIKRQYKTNTYEVGIKTQDQTNLERILKEKFQVSSTNFKSLEDDLKLKIKLSERDTPNDLLQYLTTQGNVSHFVELIPSVNDIFIQTVKNS